MLLIVVEDNAEPCSKNITTPRTSRAKLAIINKPHISLFNKNQFQKAENG